MIFWKLTEHKKCVLFWSTIFVWNIFHSKISTRYCQKGIQLFMSSTHYTCQLLMKSQIFSTDFRKILKYQIWVGTKLFQGDGQTQKQTDKKTGMTKLTVTCHNFAMHLQTQSLPQTEHSLCTLYKPISYWHWIFCEDHKKHTNTVWEKKQSF
jgi:hypothetical protein